MYSTHCIQNLSLAKNYHKHCDRFTIDNFMKRAKGNTILYIIILLYVTVLVKRDHFAGVIKSALLL